MKSTIAIFVSLLVMGAIAYQVSDNLSFAPPFKSFDYQGTDLPSPLTVQATDM